MRLVRITIGDETVRAEAGALSYLRGAIDVDVPLPSLGRAIRNILSDEPIIRPRYTGTGEIYLTPSLGGYHVLEVAAGRLDPGGRRLLGLRRRRRAGLAPGADDHLVLGRRGLDRLPDHGPAAQVGWCSTRLGRSRRSSCTAGGSPPRASRSSRAPRACPYAVRRPIRSLIGYYLSGEHSRAHVLRGRQGAPDHGSLPQPTAAIGVGALRSTLRGRAWAAPTNAIRPVPCETAGD